MVVFVVVVDKQVSSGSVMGLLYSDCSLPTLVTIFKCCFPKAEKSHGGPEDRERKPESAKAHGPHEESSCARPDLFPSGKW